MKWVPTPQTAEPEPATPYPPGSGWLAIIASKILATPYGSLIPASQFRTDAAVSPNRAAKASTLNPVPSRNSATSTAGIRIAISVSIVQHVTRKKQTSLALLALSCILLTACRKSEADPLPSWNQTTSRQAIIDFVKKVTDRASPNFVAPAERLAVFDNDGTLWAEQPLYVEVLFAADQLKVLAPQHPEWKTNPAFQQVITGPPDAILQLDGKDQFEVAFAVHSGMTLDAYSNAVDTWLATHKHPRFGKLYTDLSYTPMLEVISYLKANDFQVYSVTGAG